MTTTHCRQYFCVFSLQESLFLPFVLPSLHLCFGCSQNLLFIWLFISHLPFSLIHSINSEKFCSSTHRIRIVTETDKMQSTKVHFHEPILNQGNEVLKILERGRRIHFTYFLGSTPSPLLVHWQQIGKLVASVALRKPWQSYIK